MKHLHTWEKIALLIPLIFTILPAHAQNCDNPDVLLLGDEGSEDQVIAFLNDAGITNTNNCCF